MKGRGWRLPVFMVLALVAFGCAGDSQLVRKKAEATRNLGEAFLAQGDYPAALRELQKAEQMLPQDPYIQNDLGLVYLAHGHHETAIAHFQRALSLRPDFADARNNLGKVYLDLKQWDRAIVEFEKITEDLLYGSPHFPLTNLGVAYFHKGELDAAERYYRQALEAAPGFFIAQRGLGRTYLEKGDLRQAITHLEKAVALFPDIPIAYVDLAKAYARSGRRTDAEAAYRKVISLAPDSDLARTASQGLKDLGILP